jgi:proteic killer suppression protein
VAETGCTQATPKAQQQPLAKRASQLEKLADILDLLDAASEIRDMNFPGSELHILKGDLRSFWSVKVSGNWHVIFRFEKDDVFDVDYVDYHLMSERGRNGKKKKGSKSSRRYPKPAILGTVEKRKGKRKGVFS